MTFYNKVSIHKPQNYKKEWSKGKEKLSSF